MNMQTACALIQGPGASELLRDPNRPPQGGARNFCNLGTGLRLPPPSPALRRRPNRGSLGPFSFCSGLPTVAEETQPREAKAGWRWRRLSAQAAPRQVGWGWALCAGLCRWAGPVSLLRWMPRRRGACRSISLAAARTLDVRVVAGTGGRCVLSFGVRAAGVWGWSPPPSVAALCGARFLSF